MSKTVCSGVPTGLIFGASPAAQPTWRGRIIDTKDPSTMAGFADRACMGACLKGSPLAKQYVSGPRSPK